MNIPITSSGQIPSSNFTPSGALVGFETARFLAAIFVVWIHASIDVKLNIHPDAGFLGRFAVPFFVLSSVFFASLSVWSRPDQRFSKYFNTRFARIYLPFIAWSCVYILLKVMQGRSPPLSFALLWDGGSYQLWYLPYIFVLCICIFPAQWLVFRLQHHAKKIAALFMMLGLAVALIPKTWLGDMSLLSSNTPYLWLGALPSVFFGFALACIYAFDDRRIWASPRLIWFCVWVGGGLAVICILASCVFVEFASMLNNTSGLALGVFALGISFAPRFWLSELVKKLSPLGKVSFGIYLTHIIFIGPLRSVAASYGLNTTISFALLATVLASLSSMFLVIGLLRIRWLGWMVR